MSPPIYVTLHTSFDSHLPAYIVLYLASTPPGPLKNLYEPVFKPRRLPILSILPICTLFAGFLLLQNLSLTFNPVSFYQLAKILTVPTVVLLSFLLFRKTISPLRIVAVAVACTGVGIATGASVQSNPLGAALATASFVCTAMYQIVIGRMLSNKIDDEDVSAPQLLMNQTAVSWGMLVVLVPLFDKVPDFSEFSTS